MGCGGASSYLLPLAAIVKFNTSIVSFPWCCHLELYLTVITYLLAERHVLRLFPRPTYTTVVLRE